MTTSIPKYVQNKDVWPLLVKPGWANGGNISGGGISSGVTVPVQIDLTGGRIINSSVGSVNDPGDVANKHYVDSTISSDATSKLEFAQYKANTDLTISKLVDKTDDLIENADVEWNSVLNKPAWTGDFEDGDNKTIKVNNELQLGGNRIMGLTKPLTDDLYKSQATNREYVDDEIDDAIGDVKKYIDEEDDKLMTEIIKVSKRRIDYDEIDNAPEHIKFMRYDATGDKIQMLKGFDMSGSHINNVNQPTEPHHAVRKSYVDDKMAEVVDKTVYAADIAKYSTTAQTKTMIDTQIRDPDGYWGEVKDAIDGAKDTVTWSTVTGVASGAPKWVGLIEDEPGVNAAGDNITFIQIKGNMDMAGGRIMNVAEPSAPDDAVPKSYLDSTLANYTPTGGGGVVDGVTEAALDAKLEAERVITDSDIQAVGTRVDILNISMGDAAKTTYVDTNFVKNNSFDTRLKPTTDTIKTINMDLGLINANAYYNRLAPRILNVMWQFKKISGPLVNAYEIEIDLQGNILANFNYVLSNPDIRYRIDEILLVNDVRTGKVKNIIPLTKAVMPAFDTNWLSSKLFTVDVGTLASSTAPLVLTIFPSATVKHADNLTIPWDPNSPDLQTSVISIETIQVGTGAGYNNIELVKFDSNISIV